MNPDTLFDDLVSNLRIGREHGLDVELRATLPAGWTLELLPSAYVLRGPRTPRAEDEVWRLIRFLGYHALAAVRRRDVGDEQVWELVSGRTDGFGFRVELRLRGQGA